MSCSHNWGVKSVEGSSVLWKCEWCEEEMWVERSLEDEGQK